MVVVDMVEVKETLKKRIPIAGTETLTVLELVAFLIAVAILVPQLKIKGRLGKWALPLALFIILVGMILG